MTAQETNELIDRAFQNPAMIAEAIQRGVEDAVEQHAKAGRLLPTWRHGRLVYLNPVTKQEVPSTSLVTDSQSQ